jgi:carbon storage regulator CsrA
MLVVTRKKGQRILIPKHNIEIVIDRVLPNGAVRVGISAPDDTLIVREEIWEGKDTRHEATSPR